MPEPSSIPIGDKDSIADCFARRVAATPDAVAYRDFDAESSQWVTTTWSEASAIVGRIRVALRGEGLRRGRSRRDHGAQLPRVGAVRPGGARRGARRRAALLRRPARQRRLHPQRLGLAARRWSRARSNRRACGKSRTAGQVKRVVCVKPVEKPADARVVFLADWMPQEAPATPPVKVDGGDARHHRLHLGHHGQAQGRDALAPEHAPGREGGAGGVRGLRRGRVPLVPAAFAHARAHRRLLPHDGRGLGGRLCALHRRS